MPCRAPSDLASGLLMAASGPARAQRGFTLLEMIVVIVLVAIGLTLVSFGVTRGLDSVRVREAGRDLTLALRAVRTQAITTGQPATLDFDLSKQRYQRAGKPSQRLPAGMHMRLTTAADLRTGRQAAIMFFPDGSSTGGNIHLEKDGRAWRVDIAWLTGAVRWQEVQP
ncbi:general secretion pathway protein H [Pseudomonas duriflava]|uniref:Type II secretion system protein H n=1 Tax=Pseudomonas duriflava TaxID=459528 RepID=A0A562QIU7_9PSED|nr:GspH/FimT family pseudopilin [Pseudomonas duriflava]TWI56682.1 general secretion pathway protein H [Pseudomonas duriflava]